MTTRKTLTKQKKLKTQASLLPEKLAPLILWLRGEKVMLDSDLAELYGVETKVLNQAVKRNRGRFPEDFMFQLSKEEWGHMRSQFVTSPLQKAGAESLTENRSQFVTGSTRHRGPRARPYAFTEQP